MRKKSILFICTGNICRSPTAHTLLMHKARAAGFDVEVDSAAISDEERGNPPDRRSVAEAKRRGIQMHAHAARQVRKADFAHFDMLIGMTAQHCAALRRLAPAGTAGTADKVHLFTEFADGIEGDVPDPWYGGQQDFIEVFDLIDHGVDGLLARLQAEA
ncbi:low molecular weight protein-tyrosine-phosphatase [Variovorax sp. J22G73]|uniref:low molecular weight protein-tyrosine-phosphatase n=1 Tax=unclassified Variovorax TaxID=663243 RepID=UPI00257556F2|nr:MULTISPECIES: low molecular weight protein-tyrosine-phosphatase [unclassified Variovorax]MDM0005285.1 low molecular weight protein-tyrosine-phosphatase [Variovorax sp. J22R203]MDM0098701.1 low molecular weight protein-tyrosine-phosphatase [Variovorax sp. J22G73]